MNDPMTHFKFRESIAMQYTSAVRLQIKLHNGHHQQYQNILNFNCKIGKLRYFYFKLYNNIGRKYIHVYSHAVCIHIY